MEENKQDSPAAKSNMMPIIVGVLALLLVGGGVFFAMSNNKSATQTPNNTNVDQTESVLEKIYQHVTFHDK